MKHSQNGFGALEIIIAVVVVGLLGFGGWYVWQSNNKEAKKSDSTSQQNTNSNTQREADAYAGWKSYSKDDLTFEYPADWTLTEIGPGPQLKSSDYAATGLQTTTVTKGASVAISSPSEPQTAITAENFNTSSAWSPSYSNFKTVTINGKKAAQYNISADTVNTVLFSADGKITNLQFQFAAADYTVGLTIYNHLLETVEVK